MSNDWSALYSTALLGTGRASAPPLLPPELQPWPADVDADTEWLALVTWRAQRRRAGIAPLPSAKRVPLSDLADPLAPAGLAAADLLRRLLGGDQADAPFLREWLRSCAENQRRVPDALLPAVLTAAAKDSSLAALAEPTLGVRGHWLRNLNSAWRPAARVPAIGDWETGTKSERVAWLHAERMRDPAAARARTEAAWKGEPADFRLSMLREFFTGLSPDDESFLEARLVDRSRDVRCAAAEHLAKLPGSALVARQTARADALATFKPGGLLSRPKIAFELPPEKDDPAWERDATGLSAPQGSGVRGAKLVETLAAVPPAHWQERFSPLTPAQVIAAVQRGEDAAPVIAAWLIATVRFRDVTWAAALLSAATLPVPIHASGLARLVDEEERGRLLVARLASVGGGAIQVPERWLLGFERRWPMVLARQFLTLILSRGGQLERILETHSYQPARSAEIACLMPPAFLEEAVSAMGRREENSCVQWAERLTFARELHAVWRADS